MKTLKKILNAILDRVLWCILAIILILVFLVHCSTPTKAQEVCNSREKFIEQLSNSYSESTIGLGLVNSGSVIEVLSSLNGDTWTIIITTPNGSSCIVATGERWEKITPTKEGDGI